MDRMTLDLEALNVETFEPSPAAADLAAELICATEDSCKVSCP